jgi:hypothetical protein
VSTIRLARALLSRLRTQHDNPKQRNEGTMSRTRRVTLLELVTAVQDTARSDEEVVAVLTHILKNSVKSVRLMPEAA